MLVTSSAAAAIPSTIHILNVLGMCGMPTGENANAGPATRQLGENTVFLFFLFIPRSPRFFFVFFDVFWFF